MLSLGYNQGSLQHLPAANAVPGYGYSNNWDRLIACRDIRPGNGNVTEAVDRGMKGGVPSHFANPTNVNDPMFFHPQHPRSVENFDMNVAEKSYASASIPSKLYPSYQLPGLSYEMRSDGGLAVRNCNKRGIDGAGPQDGEAAIKKRRLVADAAR